ncbi:hypothetical protein GO684_01875, partial [Wolbachia endosymbiont of Litomosoides brasiliensis]|nr:hypothetical protein [Wolbachia endosymbiont of Litomosoides brasiliensis]
MNISKSTVHRDTQKMKFSYITPRPIHTSESWTGCSKKVSEHRLKFKLGRQNFYLYNITNSGNREGSSLFVPGVNTDCM